MKFTVGQYCILTEIVDREYATAVEALKKALKENRCNEQLVERKVDLENIRYALHHDKV